MHPARDGHRRARVDFQQIVKENRVVPGRLLLFLKHPIHIDRHGASPKAGHGHSGGCQIVIAVRGDIHSHSRRRKSGRAGQGRHLRSHRLNPKIRDRVGRARSRIGSRARREIGNCREHGLRRQRNRRGCREVGAGIRLGGIDPANRPPVGKCVFQRAVANLRRLTQGIGSHDVFADAHRVAERPEDERRQDHRESENSEQSGPGLLFHRTDLLIDKRKAARGRAPAH